MKYRKLVKQFLFVLLLAFSLLFMVYLSRTQEPNAAAFDALLWAFISASLFTLAALYRAGTGQHCALCADLKSDSK